MQFYKLQYDSYSWRQEQLLHTREHSLAPAIAQGGVPSITCYYTWEGGHSLAPAISHEGTRTGYTLYLAIVGCV